MGRVYQRGKMWWIQYYGHGQLYRESTKSSLKSVATSRLHMREGEVGQGKLPALQAEKTRLKISLACTCRTIGLMTARPRPGSGACQSAVNPVLHNPCARDQHPAPPGLYRSAALRWGDPGDHQSGAGGAQAHVSIGGPADASPCVHDSPYSTLRRMCRLLTGRELPPLCSERGIWESWTQGRRLPGRQSKHALERRQLRLMVAGVTPSESRRSI